MYLAKSIIASRHLLTVHLTAKLGITLASKGEKYDLDEQITRKLCDCSSACYVNEPPDTSPTIVKAITVFSIPHVRGVLDGECITYVAAGCTKAQTGLVHVFDFELTAKVNIFSRALPSPLPYGR